ncbi:MAG: single-stranded DNA-binding protein [Rhodospirillales bacterium]|nr:single-stranded DNA-binding protein [Rhodospirillales bacterium]MDE0378503.1 single-stranded DNA-binding protein [Rhodospirillales bacterium]
MLHINRVTLLGHAGRDPEIRALKGGDRVANFSLATTRRWKGQDGQPGESTEWHRIVVYGGAVDAVETLVRKGAALVVEGRLATREYRDRKGIGRSVTEIVVAGAQGMVNVLSPKVAEATGAETDAAEAETDGASEGAVAGEAEYLGGEESP